MRVGVLVSGGDCPGLNAAVRGAVLHGVEVYGHTYVGYRDGWRGVAENDSMPLDRHVVRGIAPTGGTILGTSRYSPFKEGGPGIEGIKAAMQRDQLDGFITIGGNGTQTVAQMLNEAGINTIGLPKTIDNDLEETDYSFGFDTAVDIATEAIDRLRTTGQSHKRCMVLEVMGREAGWIALHSGIAAGAHAILLPEFPETPEQVAAWVRHVHERGRASLVVVAEGYKFPGMQEEVTRGGDDGFGRARLGGIGEVLAEKIAELTGIETRATVLGHVQRGGVPTAFDRVLATRVGAAAADAVAAGSWGSMVAMQGAHTTLVPLEAVAGKTKHVPASRYEQARRMFG